MLRWRSDLVSPMRFILHMREKMSEGVGVIRQRPFDTKVNNSNSIMNSKEYENQRRESYGVHTKVGIYGCVGGGNPKSWSLLNFHCLP